MRPQTVRHRDTETSRLVFTARLRLQFRMPPVRNAPELRSQHDAAPVQSEYPAERRAAAAVPCRYRHRGKLQNLSSPSVLFESSPTFLKYTEDTDAKNDGPEF